MMPPCTTGKFYCSMSQRLQGQKAAWPWKEYFELPAKRNSSKAGSHSLLEGAYDLTLPLRCTDSGRQNGYNCNRRLVHMAT